MNPSDPSLASMCQRHPELAGQSDVLHQVLDRLLTCFRAGSKVLICGNGGSAADAEHWSGELLKGFERRPAFAGPTGLPPRLARKLQQGLPVIPLSGFTSLRTAVANDCHPTLEFAQLVAALGRPGDCLIGISTSGNARNVRYAARLARTMGLHTIAVTGELGGRLAGICELSIRAPRRATADVQELHLVIYHALCRAIERRIFPPVENHADHHHA